MHVNIKKALQVQGWFVAITMAWGCRSPAEASCHSGRPQLPSGIFGSTVQLVQPQGMAEASPAARSHTQVKRDKEHPRFCVETGLFPAIDAITLIIVLWY